MLHRKTRNNIEAYREARREARKVCRKKKKYYEEENYKRDIKEMHYDNSMKVSAR
jgi:hypothetical protein